MDCWANHASCLEHEASRLLLYFLRCFSDQVPRLLGTGGLVADGGGSLILCALVCVDPCLAVSLIKSSRDGEGCDIFIDHADT